MDSDSMTIDLSRPNVIRMPRQRKHGVPRLSALASAYNMSPEAFMDMVLDDYEDYPKRWQRCRDAVVHAGLYSGALHGEAALLAYGGHR